MGSVAHVSSLLTKSYLTVCDGAEKNVIIDVVAIAHNVAVHILVIDYLSSTLQKSALAQTE